jgi:hypothetical protein
MIETLLVAVAIFISGMFVSEGSRRKSEVRACKLELKECQKDFRGCYETRAIRSEDQ